MKSKELTSDWRSRHWDIGLARVEVLQVPLAQSRPVVQGCRKSCQKSATDGISRRAYGTSDGLRSCRGGCYQYTDRVKIAGYVPTRPRKEEASVKATRILGNIVKRVWGAGWAWGGVEKRLVEGKKLVRGKRERRDGRLYTPERTKEVRLEHPRFSGAWILRGRAIVRHEESPCARELRSCNGASKIELPASKGSIFDRARTGDTGLSESTLAIFAVPGDALGASGGREILPMK